MAFYYIFNTPKIFLLDKILFDLFHESNDFNENRLASSRPGEEITQFAQRLAILQHYDETKSIGIEVTKDPKVAAAFAFGSNTAKKGVRDEPAYVCGFFVPGPLTDFSAGEPRVRTDRELVCMDLAAFLPATAKRPRLQKGHMLYKARDLNDLKVFCESRNLTTQDDELMYEDSSETVDSTDSFINNEGWDANDYAIVRFCIPKNVSFHDFFKCHPGSQMDKKDFLKDDELMQRIKLVTDKNLADLSWEEQHTTMSSSKKKSDGKKQSTSFQSRKSSSELDRIIKEDS